MVAKLHFKLTPKRLGTLLLAMLLLSQGTLWGQGITTKRNYIRVDQFGYLPNARKVAVIARAVNGFNAGTGIDLDINTNVTLRRVSDNSTVFQARATIWNNGGTDELSGDRGWRFDFSPFTTTGDYYLQVRETNGNTFNSNNFKIANDVYNAVLRVAVETFFYQRVSQNKTAAHASGANWTDGAWYAGTNQDGNAQYLYSSERRNVSKGWIDAGDPNKYVTFALDPVHSLLTSYEQHPNFWNSFSLRIPESNNDLPDILDEIKWEIDWLKNMQRSDGSVHSKNGIKEDSSYKSPPSTDNRERWYSQTCPAATISASGMFAHAALALGGFSSQASYVSDLITRAENAWNIYSNAPDKKVSCDGGEIEAGNANGAGNHFLEENVAEAVCAAVYLFKLTGKQVYNNFIINNYTQARGFISGDWGIYRSNQSEALLYYTTLPNANATVKNEILNRKNSGITRQPSIYSINENSNFYGVNPFYFNWGSNSLIAKQGTDNYDYLNYNLDSGNHSTYRRTADNIGHYFPGVHPLGAGGLTNMYSYGAEFCIDKLWHTWFSPGTKYSGSPNGSTIVGPAPGFLVGGANPQANGNTVITIGDTKFSGQRLSTQPKFKAFSDENSYIVGESESPWALVENGIYYQAGYIKLLANYVANSGGNPSTPTTSGRVEIENIFSVVNEAGSNATIGADANTLGASNGQFVRLYDTNDELSFKFNVSEAGDYKMDLRVRTGEQSGTNSNLANQYEVKINGNIVAFSLVSSTISALQGDTYWGDLTRSQNLSVGEHTVTVKAKANWLKADRFNFQKVTLQDTLSSVTAPSSVSTGTNTTITVNYSASQTRKIYARLENTADSFSDYGMYTEQIVNAGSGTVNLSVPITASAPTTEPTNGG